MAGPHYVWHAGSFTDGLSWAGAYATLKAATDVAAAGEIIYVASDHVESAASTKTHTIAGTAALPVKILCAARADTTLATGASVTAGATSNNNFYGFAYIYGITFVAGSSTSTGMIIVGLSTGSTGIIFDNCLLKLGGTGATAKIQLGSAAASTSARDRYVVLKNTNLQFAAVGQTITPWATVIWRGGSLVASTYPTTLITPVAAQPFDMTIAGCDVSGVTNIADLSVAAFGQLRLRNCKVPAAIACTGTYIGDGGTDVYLDNCDNGDVNYGMKHYHYRGTIETETTIVRTGGASDGTTPISWKMVSAAESSYGFPLESPPITIWNDSTAALTVRIEIAQDSAAAALDNGEVWMEVEYPGTASLPQSVFNVSSRGGNILAPGTTDHAASAAAWGGTTPTEQYIITGSITPTQKGPIRARVMLAKPSTTLYVDPVLTIAAV